MRMMGRGDARYSWFLSGVSLEISWWTRSRHTFLFDHVSKTL